MTDRESRRWGRWGLGVASLVALALVPSVLGEFWHFFVAEMAILSLLAMSFTVVYGYGGMLSFCQGTFYGIGAYVVAWLALRGDLHPAVVLAAAVLASAAFALLTGLMFVRMGGHNFTIATVILAVVGFLTGNTLRPITGGEDGLTFSLPPTQLLGLTFPPSAMRGKLYLAVLALVIEFLESVERLPEGRDFPQGDLLLRAQDHQAFMDFYVYRVEGKRIRTIERIPKERGIYPAVVDYRKEPF